MIPTGALLSRQLLRRLSKEMRHQSPGERELLELAGDGNQQDRPSVCVSVDGRKVCFWRLSGSRIGHWHTQRMRIEKSEWWQ